MSDFGDEVCPNDFGDGYCLPGCSDCLNTIPTRDDGHGPYAPVSDDDLKAISWPESQGPFIEPISMTGKAVYVARELLHLRAEVERLKREHVEEVAAAVKVEREACACIADEKYAERTGDASDHLLRYHDGDIGMVADSIATDIRARR